MDANRLSRLLARTALLAAAMVMSSAAFAGGTPPPSPFECLHIDKIVFTLKNPYAADCGLRKGDPYDVKVEDFPNETADLKTKALLKIDENYLNSHGQGEGCLGLVANGDSSAETNGIDLDPKLLKAIKITDVEYAMDCPDFVVNLNNPVQGN